MAGKPGLLEELKRRRVFRAAALYAIVGFGVAQVADLAFPALLLPDWTVRFVVALLLLGFPVALVLAWTFDVTSDGVRRAQRSELAAAGARSSRAAGLVGLGMVIALVAFGGYHFMHQPPDGPVGRADGSAAARHSIAVLPLTTLAGGEENEYFADGLTEDILTNLGQVPDFTVISRTSVMRYKGSDKSVPEIAGELGVRYVLEGSLRRMGDRVRVVIQLIEPATDMQIWARTMDRQIEDVFALQSDIARAVVDALRVELGGGVDDRIGRVPTADIAAYELFLHGRDFYYQYSRPAMERAIDLFEQAVERDPEFALAHAWLGAARVVCVFNYACDVTFLHTGLASARRAVELQPDLGDAQRALGTALGVVGRLDEAIEPLERAVELNPNDFAAIGNLGLVYSMRGDWDRAIEVTRRSIERDPARSYIAYGNLAGYYRQLGLFDHTRESANFALALSINDITALSNLATADLLEGRPADAAARVEPLVGDRSDPSALATAGQVFVMTGHLERAREVLERAHAAAPDAPASEGAAPAVSLAYVLMGAGERARAEAILADSERLTRQAVADGSQLGVLRYSLAAIAAVRGRTEQALDYLEQAVELGYNDPALTRLDPVLESIRQEPRFLAAVERMQTRINGQRRSVS
jgi:TolB-like protein/Tfp pilus assembly protein PilF